MLNIDGAATYAGLCLTARTECAAQRTDGWTWLLCRRSFEVREVFQALSPGAATPVGILPLASRGCGSSPEGRCGAGLHTGLLPAPVSTAAWCQRCWFIPSKGLIPGVIFKAARDICSLDTLLQPSSSAIPHLSCSLTPSQLHYLTCPNPHQLCSWSQNLHFK